MTARAVVRRMASVVALSAGAAVASAGTVPQAPAAPAAVTLRAVSSFAEISDALKRSAALFTEAGKVLQHPRCVNCHPAGDRPLQGNEGRVHEPRVARGTTGHGVAGLYCTACHTAANYDAVAMPGNSHWALAPASMAWEGKSLREICEQIKDRPRNGGRTLAAIVDHMRTDPLVGWAWAPGIGRDPAPGTQAAFGSLIEAWVRTGAACPAP